METTKKKRERTHQDETVNSVDVLFYYQELDIFITQLASKSILNITREVAVTLCEMIYA